MKRVALINDLSGIGRCSLTVALPIVSAAGHECAALPTAILSNHTGFKKFTFLDFTEHMQDYISCWQELDISFDAIYSGFLGSEHQVDIALEFIEKFGRGAIKLVDPVLGDDGCVYATCNRKLQEHMRKLARAADIITPNLTELCVLCAQEYPKSKISLDKIYAMCSEFGIGKIVVTGLACDTVEGIGFNKVANFVWDNGDTNIVQNEKVPVAYCGTGDVFASVLCGKLTSGCGFLDSVRAASDFVELCVRDTYRAGGKKLYGIQFEDKLNSLRG